MDIELSEVSKVFGGRRVVDAVTLDVRRGEFFSLLGPSGSGKSTLLRIISGFQRPDTGTIRLRGRDITTLAPHLRDLNLVFQSPALFPHLDVFENVAFGLRRAGVKDVAPRVREALERVRFPGAERRRTTSLSGGEQQRVALARAIVPRPGVLLLDEPLSALDRALRETMRDELKRIQRETGITFLHVTHDQEEALALSDRMAVMKDGRIEQAGTPAAIWETPATRFVASFIGGAHLFEGRVSDGVFTTDDGLRFPAPAGSRSGRATFFARPDAVRLQSAGGLPGIVEDVLYMGSRLGVAVRLGGLRITAYTEPGAAAALGLAPGRPVGVHFPGPGTGILAE